MGIKPAVWLLPAGVLVALVWVYRVPLGLAPGPSPTGLPGAAALGRWVEGTASKSVPAEDAVRKCIVKGQVQYTNRACPAGSEEQSLKGGTLSVVSAPPVAQPASDAQGLPHARDLLGAPLGPNIKDQRMEAIIGK